VETKKKISNSKKGTLPWNKGIFLTEQHKRNISLSMTGNIPWSMGKTFSAAYVKKLQISHQGQSSPMKGRHHSNETRFKIRTSILNRLQQNGISHKSNPVACKFMDDLNASVGWSLRHAGNGGEVQVYGYLLDGYDETLGIIFEYDEPRHHLTAKKKKDIQRQRDLFHYFRNVNKPVSFWRYDERYKTLYEVFP
jgi:hypothetical protein